MVKFLLLPFFLLVLSLSFFSFRPVNYAYADDPIGKILPPTGGILATGAIDAQGKFTGITSLLNSILKLIFIAAGLWGFMNLIIAGFNFMSAGGDPKVVSQAWSRIWQTFVGLLLIATSFLFAAIIGILLFKNPLAILQPSL